MLSQRNDVNIRVRSLGRLMQTACLLYSFFFLNKKVVLKMEEMKKKEEKWKRWYMTEEEVGMCMFVLIFKSGLVKIT